VSNIRVALVGVGNCAASLVQGVEYYREVRGGLVSGLMHAVLGRYTIGDIEFVAAFDVDSRKVGLDLADAIDAKPNCTFPIASVPRRGIIVQRGPTLDGLGPTHRQAVSESDATPVDVAQVLRDTRTDVLVNYLPVGSEDATAYYMQAALDARVAVVNCIPVFTASTQLWADRFRHAGIPIIGDDIKSQVGATIVHRVLTRLFADRGMELEQTYQLNVGGNTDFLNMLERSRLQSKKISKTQAVTSQLDTPLPADSVHVGPSDYVPWLADRKVCYIHMDGLGFGDAPVHLELKLEVWDSPNSAGVVIDAVRCAKLALDRKQGGPLYGPSAYFMKSPPTQMTDDEARQAVEDFINAA
jgi:myo-inositol-1-phosphate synthase